MLRRKHCSSVIFCLSTLLAAWTAAGQDSPFTQQPDQLSKPKFLFTSDYNGGKVNGYRVNASSGAIKSTGQAPQTAGAGPTRMASDQGGYRLYVINGQSKNLSAYFIYRNNGYLHAVPGSPFAIGTIPTGVVVHPSGHYVYVTAGENWVYAFAVKDDGSLKAVSGSPFSTVDKPETAAIDPKGKYLYVSNYPGTDSPAVSKVDAFVISPADGSLTPVAGAPYTEPNSPSCANGAWDMAMHPSGKFLILPNMCEGLVVYKINQATGTLRLVKGSPFGVPYPPYPVVQSVAMDPAGKYVWISTEFCESGCSTSTDTWKFNATTGVPTYKESGESGCGLLTRADPSGKFLYVIGDTTPNSGCAGSGLQPGIWGLKVTRSNGAVKNLAGSPWASTNSDWFLTDGLAVTP